MNIFQKSIILTLYLFSFKTCLAQDFHIGVKGGGNLTNAEGYNFNDKSTYGYNFGGYVSYNLTENIGLQAELLYGKTTLRLNSTSDNQSFGIDGGKKRLNYLSVPLLAKIDVGNIFSVVAGPQFNSLRNSSKYKLNNGATAFNDKIKMSYTAGIDFGILYFRYVWGKNSFNNVNFNSDLDTQQFQLGFRVTLL